MSILIGVATGIVLLLIYTTVIESRERARTAEITAAAAARKKEELALYIEEHGRFTKEAMSMLSLTCRRCGKLAPPILDTGNRYRCHGCDNQFAGARHDLIS